MAENNGYSLSRAWFDFAFENPDKVSSGHTALYLWQVELNNRMGWSEKFASPASQSMAACGMKNYKTYIKIFNDLVEFGFIKVVQKSENQYTATIIALSKNTKPLPNQVLDQALSTAQDTAHIIKPLNPETTKQINLTVPDFSKITHPGLGTKEFKPPTSLQAQVYMTDFCENKMLKRDCKTEAEIFVNHYTTFSWVVNDKPVWNWETLANNWILNNYSEKFGRNKQAETKPITAKVITSKKDIFKDEHR